MARLTSDKEWQARDDLRTLQQAEEIRKSRSRLNAANSEAKKQMEALRKVAKPAPKAPRGKPRAKPRGRTTKR